MNENNYMGKWELGCIVLNSIVYKILTGYTEKIVTLGGAAAWMTAAFDGIIFLVILKIVIKAYEPYADEGILDALQKRGRSGVCRTVAILAAIYFIFSAINTLSLVCSALKIITYTNSPRWFLAIFFIVGAILTAVCGERAVRRIHSLTVLGICVIIVAIVILSLKYSDVYNLFPIFGNGAKSVFGKGLCGLFLYSDIAVLPFLPRRGGEYSYKRTVMNSARIGVLLNVLVILAVTLNINPAERIDLPLYPLTKTANIGKLSARLDAAYQVVLIVSALVYLSLAVRILLTCFRKASFKIRRTGGAILCLVLCLSLCGCYDGNEVEENAYAVAVGVDKGENAAYSYTFQISNPLDSGRKAGIKPADKEQDDDELDETNKTVDNITVEGDDYFHAADKLKSILSKDLSLSHLKLLVFSEEAAENGVLEHGELILHEREVRPGTNLCLARSARDFLVNVKPTLEKSTVRYYELYFKNYKVPYAPVTQLREFVGRSSDPGNDAVIPEVKDGSLEGMGLFSNGRLCGSAEAEEVVIYKLLRGELKSGTVENFGKTALISSGGKPKIKIKLNGETIEAEITARIKIDDGDLDTADKLNNDAKNFLNNSYQSGCDVLGIGRRLKKNFLTQQKWDSFDWRSKIKNCKFTVNFWIK